MANLGNYVRQVFGTGPTITDTQTIYTQNLTTTAVNVTTTTGTYTVLGGGGGGNAVISPGVYMYTPIMEVEATPIIPIEPIFSLDELTDAKAEIARMEQERAQPA